MFFSLRNITVVGAVSIMLLSGSNDIAAQAYTDPYKDYLEEVFMDMEFLPNLATPVVPAREKAAVQQYVRKVATGLKNDFTIDLMRDGEVFIVTIPSDAIFLPNDTLLADEELDPIFQLLPLLEDPMMYKLVIAMHSDDTGSEYYREWLTSTRLNSIYDWFMDAVDQGTVSEDQIIIPYAMGGSDPLYPNDTRKHRKENRRLELYFIPGPKMIELAHKGLLNK